MPRRISYCEHLLQVEFVTLGILTVVQYLWKGEWAWNVHLKLSFPLSFQLQNRLPCDSIRKQGKLCRACGGIAERIQWNKRHQGRWWGSSELLLVPVNPSPLLQLVRCVWGWRNGREEIPGVWLCPFSGASPVTLKAIQVSLDGGYTNYFKPQTKAHI